MTCHHCVAYTVHQNYMSMPVSPPLVHTSPPHAVSPPQTPSFPAPAGASKMTWQALNTLCWAIGSISGSMQVGLDLDLDLDLDLGQVGVRGTLQYPSTHCCVRK